MPPNNKKQRGRNNQKKKEAQNAAQKKAEAVLRRAQIEAELQGKFGTPAVDNLIREMASVMIESPQPAGEGTAPGAASTFYSNSTTEKEDAFVCFHGSSAQHFVAGSEFLKIVQSYVVLNKKSVAGGYDQWNNVHDNFFRDKENRKIMYNVEFTNFVFALGVSLYLRITYEEKKIILDFSKCRKVARWGKEIT